VSGSDVEIRIGTAKDVDVMHHSRQGAGLVNFYWLVMSSAMTLRQAQGGEEDRTTMLRVQGESKFEEQELPLDYSLWSRSRHHSPRGDTTIVNPYWLAMSEP